MVDVDASFGLDDGWYASQTERQPPKDKPWYHVLVDQTDMSTYVPERNLQPDHDGDPIDHPDVDDWLDEADDGHYSPLAPRH